MFIFPRLEKVLVRPIMTTLMETFQNLLILFVPVAPPYSSPLSEFLLEKLYVFKNSQCFQSSFLQVDKLHAHGILVMNMVGAPKHVPKALAAGVDLICAQGGEGIWVFLFFFFRFLMFYFFRWWSYWRCCHKYSYSCCCRPLPR